MVVLVSTLAFGIIQNGGFASIDQNPFIGPEAKVSIRLGGKYVPCMRWNSSIPADEIPENHVQLCGAGYTGKTDGEGGICTYYNYVEWVCGMGGFSDPNKPDQVWRFITPMFLHSGILHLLLNSFFLSRTGFPMEKQIGTYRMVTMYVLSGIGGNLFSCLMSPKRGTYIYYIYA